jgi:hypothetical protein
VWVIGQPAKEKYMERRPNDSTFHVFVFASIVLSSMLVMAQAPNPAADKQARVAAIKQSLAQNQATLKQYTWIETTQVSMKGEVKKEEQKQCFYGADGKVQKTPLSGAAPPQQQQPQRGGGQRGGRVKKNIVENKVEDLKDYLEKVAALVKDYVPPDPQNIQAAETAGNISVQPAAQGAVTLTIKNYLKMGDSLALGFDTTANKMNSYNVNSYVEKPKDDVVTLAVTFGRLDDGTSFPQQVVLDAKAKNVQVKITNAGYKKKT